MTRTPWSPRSSDAAPRGKVRIVRLVHKAAAEPLSASPAVPSQRPRARSLCAPARAMGRSNRNVCRCCDDVGVSARSLHSVTVMYRTWTKNGLELRQPSSCAGLHGFYLPTIRSMASVTPPLPSVV